MAALSIAQPQLGIFSQELPSAPAPEQPFNPYAVGEPAPLSVPLLQPRIGAEKLTADVMFIANRSFNAFVGLNGKPWTLAPLVAVLSSGVEGDRLEIASIDLRRCQLSLPPADFLKVAEFIYAKCKDIQSIAFCYSATFQYREMLQMLKPGNIKISISAQPIPGAPDPKQDPYLLALKRCPAVQQVGLLLQD